VESSGVYTTTERAATHLAGGAQRVVITAPSADAPTFIMGCNEDGFKGSTQVFSAGSCTAAALAPPLKLLNQNFGVTDCSFTTIHGATSQQRMVDHTNAQDYRMGRSAHDNVVPCATTAVKSVVKALPKLAGRISGMAIRVPTTNVCLLDVTVTTERAVSKIAVDALFRNETIPVPVPVEEGAAPPAPAARHPVVGFTSDAVVSSDFNRDTHACIYDATASMVLHKNAAVASDDANAPANSFKLLFWYDNEAGYVHQVLSLIVATSAKW
jgi:glyceraldehyde 3-phosphate dehydrogenase